MPHPSPENVIAENNLPREVSTDVNVQQQLAQLIEALRTSSEVHGFGGRIRITLQGLTPAPERQAAQAVSVAGGSPGDWYENEDQMTHGGSGKGGNWNDDDRVL